MLSWRCHWKTTTRWCHQFAICLVSNLLARRLFTYKLSQNLKPRSAHFTVLLPVWAVPHDDTAAQIKGYRHLGTVRYRMATIACYGGQMKHCCLQCTEIIITLTDDHQLIRVWLTPPVSYAATFNRTSLHLICYRSVVSCHFAVLLYRLQWMSMDQRDTALCTLKLKKLLVRPLRKSMECCWMARKCKFSLNSCPCLSDVVCRSLYVLVCCA